MAGYSGREQQLRLEIESCPEGPVLAGLLTELAGLHIAAGRMDEAGGLLQQAYAIRMQELAAGFAGASISMVAAAPQQPVQQPPPQQPEQQQPPQLWQDHQQQVQQQPPQLQPEQQMQPYVWQDLQQAEQQQTEQQPQPQPKVWQDHQQPEQQQTEQQLQTQLRQEDQQPGQQQLEQQHRHQQQLDMLRHQEPDSSSEGTDTAEDSAPVGPESSSSQQSAAEHGVAAAGSSTAFAEQQADGQQQQSDGAKGWDNSDDWEPDLSALHTAGSFERRSQQRQVQQASSVPAAGRSSVSKADRSTDWRRPSSNAGSRPSSQPRGRGDSKCGAASDADSDSGWDLAGVANQPHIVEIYNLTRSVKTTHIDEFLLEFMWGGTTANVKWVDDEHALAVFPCAEAAQVLLDSSQKEFKVRPYNKASGAALQIAADELLPPRSARPKTTTAVARRLISNALGNREVRDKAAERQLADMRKANKQGKQQRQQQLNEAWGDD